MLKIIQRDCTLQDFLQMKKIEPWKKQRDKISKPANFSLSFGMAGITFAGILEKDVFTEDELNDFIKDVGLEQKVDEMMNEPHLKFSRKKVKFIAAAEFIRNAFFNSYHGLGERLERELRFAIDNGYVRSWHGGVRHLAQLKYMTFGKKGLIGLDRELYSHMFSGLKNDAGNSTIQTIESDVTQRSFIEITHYLKKWGLKSRLWNQCHDSADYFIYVGDGEDDPDNEERLVCALIHALDTWDRDPHYGIPQEIDAEIADVSTDEKVLEGNWYHSGKHVDFTSLNLNDELEKWNKLHNTNHVFEKLDELNWKL